MRDAPLDVEEALDVAAGSGNDRLTSDMLASRRTNSKRRVAEVRSVIMRFLENLPEDATVVEVRDALDRGAT